MRTVCSTGTKEAVKPDVLINKRILEYFTCVVKRDTKTLKQSSFFDKTLAKKESKKLQVGGLIPFMCEWILWSVPLQKYRILIDGSFFRDSSIVIGLT